MYSSLKHQRNQMKWIERTMIRIFAGGRKRKSNENRLKWELEWNKQSSTWNIRKIACFLLLKKKIPGRIAFWNTYIHPFTKYTICITIRSWWVVHIFSGFCCIFVTRRIYMDNTYNWAGEEHESIANCGIWIERLSEMNKYKFERD